MSFKGPMVDMEMDDEDQFDSPAVPTSIGEKPKKPQYPYGLRISLTHKDMEKQDLEMPMVGDTIDFRAFGVVTSVSASQSENYDDCRVEIQIQKLRVENEDTEEE